jgi:NAD(P)-dependent dehydrogenase (short-subunit alcohol dehydrogenase family)
MGKPRALITGCSTGIGRATAVELAKRGYEVVATARRAETLDDLDVAQRLALDVTSDASVAAAVSAAGEIDVLVNNAGIGVDGPVEHVPLDEAQQMFDTNFWGAARMVQALAPGMRARSRGAIVNVTSLAGRAVGPLNGYYSASKWALEALSEAMDAELRHWGIRVIVIEPGYIDTPILGKGTTHGIDAPPYDELAQLWDEAVAKLQGGAIPGPELVAGAIADALEADEPPLRHPVGADAEMVVTARDSMSYEEFIATMREFLGLDW